MINLIENIIQGYGMGPIRALAQEPPQNAKDAHKQKLVRIKYRLIKQELKDGEICYLLTVTDSGTTGLQGPVLSQEDIEAIGEYRNRVTIGQLLKGWDIQSQG
jgi:hypothetical protein